MAGPRPRLPSSARIAKADLLAALAFVLVPLVVFGVPALGGHLSLTGDNLAQNYPLRVLVGRQVRAGTFPTYNPYIWGGAPLLGGWNAGALYPLTGLFAVLPPTGAWALNEMAVYWVAGLGLYALLRTLGLRPLASFLGAGTFAFGGAMQVHLVHLGLVAGVSWLPLVLLALVRLDRAGRWAERAPWVVLLAVSGGLCILAGEPRAVATDVVVGAVFLAWLVLRRGPGRLGLLAGVGAGALLAALIGAVQWVPGVMTVATSQRAGNGFALYAFGSLPPKRLWLLLNPNLLGGTGSLRTVPWFVDYNLPEDMSYVGLLPLVAVCALAGGLLRRRRGERWPDWLVWFGLAVLGVVLAFGAYTPLGHVLAAVPAFGGQRLQSRNIAITDLALAVLLGYWVDGLLTRRAAAPGRRPSALDLSRVFGSIPLLGAAILAAVALSHPSWVAELAGASLGDVAHAAAQRPLYLTPLAVVAAGAVALWWGDRLPRRVLGAVLGVAVVADLAMFGLTSAFTFDLAPAPNISASATTDHTSGLSRVAVTQPPAFGRDGRFAIYDPSNTDAQQLASLATPDLNVLDSRYSVVGYSSIVDGQYASILGAHAAIGDGTNALSPAAIASGALNQLSTRTLLTLPESLIVRLGPGAANDSYPGLGIRATGRRALTPGHPGHWTFARTLDVSAVTVGFDGGRSARPPSAVGVDLGLVSADGHTTWQAPGAFGGSGRSLTVRPPRPERAVGLTVRLAGGRATLGPPRIATVGGAHYVAAGALQDAVVSPSWTFDGDTGPFAYFTNHRAAPPLWVRAVGAPGGAATVRAVAGAALAPTSARVRSAHGAEVVRAVTMIPGWSASWRSSSGPVRALPVRRFGLVQSVTVPAGEGTVTWRYRAPGAGAGVLAAGLGFLGTAGVATGALVGRRRRRRRSGERPGPQSG